MSASETERLREEVQRLRMRVAELERTQYPSRTAELFPESQQLLSNLLRYAPMPIYILSADGRYELVNRAWEEVAGRREQEVLGKSMDDLWPGDVIEQLKKNNRQVIVTASIVSAEEFAEMPDGRHYYHSVKFPLFDEGGQVARICGIAVDVTARRRTENALRESDRLFRCLWDSNLMGFATCTSDRVLDANKEYLNMLGYTSQDVIDGKARCHLDARALEELETTGACRPFRPRLRRADGGEVPVLTGAVLLEKSPLKWICFTVDRSERERLENALRESEERFKAFMDNSPAFAFIKDPEGHYVYINQPFERVMATQGIDGMQGGHIGAAEWLPREMASRLSESEAIVLKTGKDVETVESISLPDGTLRHFTVLKFPLHDATGRPFVGGIAVDITERKRVEEALRESQLRYSTLATAVPEILFSALEDGQADYASQRFYDYTGLPPGAAEGLRWMAALHPEDAERSRAHWLQCVREGKPFQIEYRFRRADGVYRWFMGRAVPVRDEGGRIVKWFGLCTDIDDLKRAQAALRESQELFRRLWESNIIGIVTANREKITDANDAYLKMVGYTREELREGKLCWPNMTPPEFRPLDERCLRQLETAGSCMPYEKAHYHKNGHVVPFLIGAAVLERSPLTWICYMLDLTARKQMEERLRQAQKMESVGVLAGGVAHDFNNLLLVIMGRAAYLLDTMDENDPASESLQAIVKASERAADLTRQLLAYAGKGQFLLQSVNLTTVVDETLALIRSSLPPKTRLTVDLTGEFLFVDGDPSQIQQLVMNLVINAVEAIGEQEGVISVATRSVDLESGGLRTLFADEDLAPGRYVSLEVRDTGCGMDEATKARIFDPFFTTKFTGRGLGLAAVQGIVRAEGGAIRISTAPSQGSIFEVLLPASKQVRVAVPERAPTKMPARATGTILVIDDEGMVRQVAERILTQSGFTVLLAEGGRHGLEVFRENAGAIDLVLLDLTMPVMGGGEVCDELQKIRPGVKVLVTSGYGEQEAARRFAGKPIAGFLQKPYTVRQLEQKVGDVLQRRAGEDHAVA